MSAISWSTEFSAINCYRDVMEPCNYNINITFDDESLSPEDQATAFGRIRHLIKDLYQDAIFIWLGHPLLPTLHKKLNSKIVTLPFAPNNYCVGTTTWYKILSITQGRVSLTNIDLSADKSDNICIHIDQDMVTEDELMQELAMKNWNNLLGGFVQLQQHLTFYIRKKAKLLWIITRQSGQNGYNGNKHLLQQKSRKKKIMLFHLKRIGSQR